MTPRFAVALLVSLGLAGPAEAQERPDSTLPARKQPNRLDELVTTASRTSQAISTSPLAVTVVTRADLAGSTAPSVANLLGRIPGFSMRDYQSSLLNNTARSVPSFRGLSGSTAGRTLVLLDGVPLNESFSGRMNWRRIPMTLVDRVEVVRGGGSMIWGSRSLGGVINILTEDPARTGIAVQAEAGTFATYRGSVAAGLRKDKLTASVSGDWAGTDGTIVIRNTELGAADVPNGSEDRVVLGKVAYEFTPRLRAYVAGNYLSQSSNGPTPISDGSADIGEVRGGLRLATSGSGVVEFAGYFNSFHARSLRGVVSRDRTTASVGETQAIPANSVGTSIQWSQTALERHHLTAGLDAVRIDGSLIEGTNYSGGQLTLQRTIAGKQLLGGVFLQDNVILSDRWRLLAGLRLDGVRSYAGTRADTSLVTHEQLMDTTYHTRTFSRLNYSLGIRHAASDALDWRASVYAAFRAPSLTETYQTNYSSRGTVTAANPNLLPERLIGAEIGADLDLGQTVLARATVFWNKVRDPIVDYTIGTATTSGQIIEPCGPVPKDQVCRQRRNVNGLRTMGIESEVEFHPMTNWSFWTSYTFNPTKISAPGQEIDGVVARGTARHAATAVLTYDNPSLLSVTLEGRYIGERSDDDLDSVKLDSFTVAGIRITRRLWQRSSVYLKVDNLFDTEYVIAQLPGDLVEIGAPRWVTVGMRASW